MSPITEKGLRAITDEVNLMTGLTHSNDKNKTKEMFIRLHQAEEILLKAEISAWATAHGWLPEDAKELGALAEQIGMGKNVRVKDGPWWNDGIVQSFKSGGS